MGTWILRKIFFLLRKVCSCSRCLRVQYTNFTILFCNAMGPFKSYIVVRGGLRFLPFSWQVITNLIGDVYMRPLRNTDICNIQSSIPMQSWNFPVWFNETENWVHSLNLVALKIDEFCLLHILSLPVVFLFLGWGGGQVLQKSWYQRGVIIHDKPLYGRVGNFI